MSFVFDGGTRFAQVIPDSHDNGRGPGDGYSLGGFGGSAGCFSWSGPAGTRISSLTFEDDSLRVQLYGEIKLGSFECSIPCSAPEVYVLPWPSESPNPPMHNLHAMFFNTPCQLNEANTRGWVTIEYT